jgi:SAM-dependent methyltransferase
MKDEVRLQYATSRSLAARGSFHRKYASVDWFGWLVDRIAMQRNAEVLDIGCGPAWLWRAQGSRVTSGLRLTLIDTSAGMIEEAKANLADRREQFGQLDFRTADAVALPYDNESFDSVLLLHVLYHVDDRRRALEEALRVLRPGGSVFVSTNATDNMIELHAIGASAFGGAAVDPGAARFSLDDAEVEIGALFTDVRRHDLTFEMVCTDPDDAVAVLLSMPPGNTSTTEQQEHVAKLLHEKTERDGGALRVTRHTGLVEGIRQKAAIHPDRSISQNGQQRTRS